MLSSCFPGCAVKRAPLASVTSGLAKTNGKIEAFWDIFEAEVLDRECFTSFAHAEAALEKFAKYYRNLN